MLRNFALFFLGVAPTALGTMATAPPAQDRAYYTLLIVFIIILIAGVVLLSVRNAMHRSVASLIKEIRAQMPANPPIERGVPGTPDAGEERRHTTPGG